MKFDRLTDLTSELSTNLVKSIVFPTGFWDWLTRPLSERRRDRKAGSRTAEAGETAYAASVAAGPMVLVGGSPIPDEAVVAMIHLVGGRSASMAVIPVAAKEAAPAAAEGLRAFTRFGMRNVEIFDLTNRERADSEEWATNLSEFDGVFLCGEDPLVGLEVLSGTRCAQTLQEMMAAGKPVAGMAGAAAMLGAYFLAERGGDEEVIPGLGLAPGLMVDPYFTQRARFSRLAQAFNQECVCSCLGVGIDGGTSVVIRDEEARVLGEGSATFLWPDKAGGPSEQGVSAPGAMAGLKVNVLLDGFGLNLRTRKPTAPVKEAAEASAQR